MQDWTRWRLYLPASRSSSPLKSFPFGRLQSGTATHGLTALLRGQDTAAVETRKGSKHPESASSENSVARALTLLGLLSIPFCSISFPISVLSPLASYLSGQQPAEPPRSPEPAGPSQPTVRPRETTTTTLPVLSPPPRNKRAMKFGHAFKQSLADEGFPPDWVGSAISYSQLKKCIKRLTSELHDMGLGPAALSKLLKHVEDFNAAAGQDEDQERPFEYILNQDDPAEPSPRLQRVFHPQLLFYVDEATDEVISARLDRETKRKLQTLAVETGLSELRVFEESSSPRTSFDSIGLPGPAQPGSTSKPTSRPGYRTVKVPLTSDTEFFSRLTTEVSGLEKLQKREQKIMNGNIEHLGKMIAKLTDPDKRSNRKMLIAWRQVFQLYVEEGIFFGTTELDHEAHSSEKAMQRLTAFSNKVSKAGLVDQMGKKDNLQAFNQFLHINRDILQGLRFGEINHSAMLKILKKFDKQTALSVKSTFPRQVQYPEFSENLAKMVCAEVNTRILSHIPQLDDYSCPMCFDIKWRPVKLDCGHTFCIRCLIVMQNNKQHNCPFCREPTVLGANSDNLDQELATFLKKWFPAEVKTKQKYNELMAGVDQYGEVYADHKCTVM